MRVQATLGGRLNGGKASGARNVKLGLEGDGPHEPMDAQDIRWPELSHIGRVGPTGPINGVFRPGTAGLPDAYPRDFHPSGERVSRIL